MPKQLITSDELPPPGGPYSPGLVVGDWIFLAGQGGSGDDVGEQTEQVFRKIETLLAGAGASLENVVSCLVHLADLEDLAAFNAVYERQFPGIKPVRTTVRADLIGGIKVEITVIAKT